MKIGILTFHFAHNYGAMLQAYALKSYLSQQGNDVDIIAYESKFFYRQYKSSPFVIKKNPLAIVKNFTRYFYKKPQVERFDNFKSDYLNIDCKRLSTQAEVNEVVNNYDIIIVGSDQVWNKNLTNADMVYFGEDATDSTSYVSYAACMGDYDMSDPHTVELVESFKALSVREQDAVETLKSKGIDAQLCVDPVFLCDRDFWRGLKNKSKVNLTEPYILYYSLQEPQALIDRTQQLAQKTGLPVKMIDGKLRARKMNGELLNKIGPLEFLSLINGAEYICTDSFHALSFSILFGKKVLLEAHKKTGSRTKQLLSLVGVENTAEVIDCANLDDSRLCETIKSSKEFLLTSIAEDKNEN